MIWSKYNLLKYFRRWFDDAVTQRGRSATSGQSNIGAMAPDGILVPQYFRWQDSNAVGSAARLDGQTSMQTRDLFLTGIIFRNNRILVAHTVSITIVRPFSPSMLTIDRNMIIFLLDGTKRICESFLLSFFLFFRSFYNSRERNPDEENRFKPDSVGGGERTIVKSYRAKRY